MLCCGIFDAHLVTLAMARACLAFRRESVGYRRYGRRCCASFPAIAARHDTGTVGIDFHAATCRLSRRPAQPEASIYLSFDAVASDGDAATPVMARDVCRDGGVVIHAYSIRIASMAEVRRADRTRRMMPCLTSIDISDDK